jgi:hypothetical protein
MVVFATDEITGMGDKKESSQYGWVLPYYAMATILFS